VPRNLLRRSADAAFTSGDGQAGETLLNRAALRMHAGEEKETSALNRAVSIGGQGRRLITRGDPGQAGQLFRRAHQLFTAERSEAGPPRRWGGIDGIAERRGDYDEAQRIRREARARRAGAKPR
jgi:hypothetical protein